MRRGFSAVVFVMAMMTAAAQAIDIFVPPARFVEPNETVTLTFGLTSQESVEVLLEASSSSDWSLEIDPATATLEPGVAVAVSLTVEVPADAPAFAIDRVTLAVSGVTPAVERTVELTVLDIVDLRLELPAQAALGTEGLSVVVSNAGNTSAAATLELRRDDELLERRELRIGARERRSLRFDLAEEGPHTLRLSTARGVELERTIEVLRFGTPAPEPYVLEGRLTAGFAPPDDWDGRITLKGPLSDFSSVDVRADAPRWRRSYGEVRIWDGSVRIGAVGSSPFRLDLSKDFGVTATYDRDGSGAAGMVGVTRDDRLSAFVAGAWATPTVTAAAGAGWREDGPLASLRASYADADVRSVFEARYRDEKLQASLAATIRAQQTATSLSAQARDVLTERSRLTFKARFRVSPTTLYGEVTTPLGTNASWAWRAGLTQGLDVDVPGSLQVAFEAGDRRVFGRVAYRVSLGRNWRTATTLGAQVDAKGFGVTLDSSWRWLSSDSFSFAPRLVYYPEDRRIEGTIRADYELVEDPLLLALGGTWNLNNETVTIKSTLGLYEGPWELDVDGSARYAYAREDDRWTLEWGVAASYAFEITVPPAWVEATGGRRLGTLVGRVTAVGDPVPSVVVRVGRFRALTDDEGRFELLLEPGTYRLAVDRSTVPDGLAVQEPRLDDVQVELRETTEVVFEAVPIEP